MNSAKGHPGNQHAKKLTTPEIKAEAYRQYCEWIASGNAKEAWGMDHPEMTLTYKTIEKYMRESPSDFPPIHKERAETKSYEHWCELGKDMMVGKIKKCQPAIYQMFMRNKFGWDKVQPTQAQNENDARRALDHFEKE